MIFFSTFGNVCVYMCLYVCDSKFMYVCVLCVCAVVYEHVRDSVFVCERGGECAD